MWYPLIVKHDELFHALESPLADHLANRLNQFEQEKGKITSFIGIQNTSNVIEIVVHVEELVATIPKVTQPGA